MTQFYSLHAKDRAWERYGLDLSSNDMAEILRATKDGRAQLMMNLNGQRIFVWRFKDRMVIPQLAADRKFIVTFMPADYFLKSSRRDHKEEIGVMRVGHRRNGRAGKNYRRPKSNRHTIREMGEE